MNKRAFFMGAVLLALIALITHIAARSFLEDAMHRHAARIAQALKQQTAYTPDSQALQSSRRYNILTTVGVVLTALSAVCMVTARVRHEKGWYLILILILFFDVVAPMLL
jgi:predicted lipid-binding transport protein (Tim44 family)